jgi:hypothetical protein
VSFISSQAIVWILGALTGSLGGAWCARHFIRSRESTKDFKREQEKWDRWIRILVNRSVLDEVQAKREEYKEMLNQRVRVLPRIDLNRFE